MNNHDNYLLNCVECGKAFFTDGEKAFYESKGLISPKRCKDCRDKLKTQREITKLKSQMRCHFGEIFDVISDLQGSNALFVIGNGFDLFHGVKSSYYDFGMSLGQRSYLRDTLEFIIKCDDLWGDFEGNLAKVDRNILMNLVETFLDDVSVSDPEDENFSAAEFYAAVENGLTPIDSLIYDLPVEFKRWVKKLAVSRDLSEDINQMFLMPDKHKFLNFNYTDFLESLYKVPIKDIKYIHGCRKIKDDNLILGHGENPNTNLEDWQNGNQDKYIVHKNRYKVVKRKNGKIHRVPRYESMTELAYFDPVPEEGNWKTPIHYYALEQAVSKIEDYFEQSRKNTNQIIKDNEDWFSSCKLLSDIVILGHSLMPVDYPYFMKLREFTRFFQEMVYFLVFTRRFKTNKEFYFSDGNQ